MSSAGPAATWSGLSPSSDSHHDLETAVHAPRTRSLTVNKSRCLPRCAPHAESCSSTWHWGVYPPRCAYRMLWSYFSGRPASLPLAPRHYEFNLVLVGPTPNCQRGEEDAGRR